MKRCYFTLDEYRDYLALALAAGYRFVGFEDRIAAAEPGAREILLRHDVDLAPKYMPPMAAIEAELGVRSTYCVLVDSRWYSIDTPENRAAIEETLDLGHWLGLHFDASLIESDGVATERVVEQACQLGAAFSREVRVVSFHMPGRRAVNHLELPNGLINTYGPRFFTEIGYASDSNENWHGADLEASFAGRTHDRLQMLIHPFLWRTRAATMRSKMQEFADEIGVDIHEIVTPEQWQVIEQREAAA
jgi:hypothetical protein